MGTEGGRHLRGGEVVRVVARRCRRSWDKAEDEEAVRGVSLAINRPTDARAQDVVALQRLAGNEAVVQLAEHAATAPEEEEINPAPGPYVGPRRHNDKMDGFEDEHLLGPEIFRNYAPYWDLWTPLAGLIGKYFIVNVSTEGGIRLNTDDRRVAAWVIVERFNSKKAADIRRLRPGPRRDGALLDAVWGEFGAQYRFAKSLSEREWRHSNFLLFHEWAAVRFGLVQPPYAYWAKGRTGR